MAPPVRLGSIYVDLCSLAGGDCSSLWRKKTPARREAFSPPFSLLVRDMLNTRNIRLVAAACVLFTIVGLLAFSSSSIGHLDARAKPSSDFAVAHEELGNTLLGSPHKGTEAPYKAVGGAKVNKVAESNAEDSVPEKPAAVVADVTKDKAKAAAEKCDKTDYVVMIDAGSTGSRIHVYEFNTCMSPPQLLSEEFKMLNPGLSSFDTDTKGAAASLDPLLEVALKKVPEAKRGCTPVAVKATAGLRLLGKEKSDAILAEVRTHLETDYPFAVVSGDGISIMDGKDEGVFAWITTNYLLGNIGLEEKIPTAAVFDLGGGSTQIVFEPEFVEPEAMAEGDHKYQFSFGNRDFTLYQFSHLGYGLMEGRNKVNKVVLDSALKGAEVKLDKYASKKATKDVSADATILNPCIPPGEVAKNVVVQVDKEEFYVVNFKGPAQASGAQCRQLAESVLNMDSECATGPCSFNGVYQPSLVKAFHRNSDMWVFSYFYDKTNPLGFPSSFTVEELRDLTSTVCSGSKLWKEVMLGDSVDALAKEPHWCLDLSFITAMLHTGYNIPLSRELRTAKKIADNELGWCLGASLPLLDPKTGGWSCRA